MMVLSAMTVGIGWEVAVAAGEQAVNSRARPIHIMNILCFMNVFPPGISFLYHTIFEGNSPPFWGVLNRDIGASQSGAPKSGDFGRGAAHIPWRTVPGKTLSPVINPGFR